MNRILTAGACAVCLVASCLRVSAQQGKRINLREWGYKPHEPRTRDIPIRVTGPSNIISIGENSEIAVGFVTHDRWGLASRELPPLSFNIVKFNKAGKFLSQSKLPTPSWGGNSVFYGANNEMLVRTGTKLLALSPSMKPVAEMELPDTEDGYSVMWLIYPLPNRTAFLLGKYGPHRDSIALRRWDNLKVIKKCPAGNWLQGASDDSVLFMHPGNKSEYERLPNTVEASKICGGPPRFSYSWKYTDANPDRATLIGDDNLLLAGLGSIIRFVAHGKVQWEDKFNKKHDTVSPEVKISSDGRFAAIAVQRFIGGSRLFDINAHLKAVRIIVYEISSGKNILEIPVEPTPAEATPSYGFDFALSPAGDLLAVVSDGFLRIVPASSADR